MKLNLKITVLAVLLVAVFSLVPADLVAQCPMCRATAETNMRNGGTAGAGLNAGILYMLVAPYLIVGGVAYWWWRNRRKNADDSMLPDELVQADDVARYN
jgi:hypothetical protein